MMFRITQCNTSLLLLACIDHAINGFTMIDKVWCLSANKTNLISTSTVILFNIYIIHYCEFLTSI